MACELERERTYILTYLPTITIAYKTADKHSPVWNIRLHISSNIWLVAKGAQKSTST